MDVQAEKWLGPFSIIGAIVGAASLWFADLYCLFLGLAAVFLSLIASRRKERLNSIGMILGCIALIFVNLQFIGIVKSNPKISDDLERVFTSIRISNQAYEILKNSRTRGPLNDEDMSKMINLWERAIEEAKKVNTDNIDVYVPKFSKHYRKEFIGGLKLLVDGLKNSDDNKKLEGAFLMDIWGIWNKKNYSIYRKIKRKKISFIQLLYESMAS